MKRLSNLIADLGDEGTIGELITTYEKIGKIAAKQDFQWIHDIIMFFEDLENI